MPVVDEDRLRATVVHLSETLHPRSFDHHAQLQMAGRYIRDAFLATGATVTLQEFTVDEERYFNVVARFGPADGALTVVGAHYDSYADVWSENEAGQTDQRSTHTPGADDNASGVAGLLELARLLGQNPPPRPVLLVAYSLEEPPHGHRGHRTGIGVRSCARASGSRTGIGVTRASGSGLAFNHFRFPSLTIRLMVE